MAGWVKNSIGALGILVGKSRPVDLTPLKDLERTTRASTMKREEQTCKFGLGEYGFTGNKCAPRVSPASEYGADVDGVHE